MTIMTRAVPAVAAFLCAFFLGVVVTAPAAHAYTYNGSKAGDYAEKWAANASEKRNDAYKDYKYDCTNFASQALRAGGMTDDKSGDNEWWHDNLIVMKRHSESWSIAYKLRDYLRDSGRGESITSYYGNMSSKYTNARRGDIYVYEWANGDGHVDHVAVATGYGTFADFYDTKKAKHYRSVTGGSGDYMAQHSTDRDKAPWNWGFHNESDYNTRKKMKTWVIRIA